MKNIVRILCFCMLLGLVLWKTDSVLAVKYGDGIYGMTRFYQLDNETVDVLILGSSHAFEDVNTGVLWEQYGMASYVLAGSVQPMWNTYYYLKEALKTQTPQLIILEAYTTVFAEDYIDDSRIIKNTYGMKWSADRVDAVKVSAPKERWTEFLLPYIQYHMRYAELSRADFLENQGDIQYQSWKGFGCNMATIPFETPDVSGVTERAAMKEKTETYYRKTIELALESNIPLLIVLSPYAGITQAEQEIFLTAGDIAAEYGVDFVNYNLLYEELGIDFSCDAADAGHLNYRGNQKFTAALGDYAASHFTVSDHREDPAYASWDAQAGYIKAGIKKQELTEVETVDELKGQILDSDYLYVVSIDGDCAAKEPQIQKLFEALEIPYVKDSGFWTVCKGKAAYSAGMGDGELHLRLDWHDLYVLRSWNMANQSYTNTVMLDRTSVQKVDKGVNILIYDAETQAMADAFGIHVDDLNGKVLR